MIPMVDLRVQYHELKEEIDRGILDALEKTQFILGPNVAAFEKEAAEYLGTGHAIALNSGTDALHLALMAAGVGAGDEVITTAFTFIATAEAISYVGARPVFVDVDPRTFNMLPSALEAAITARTKAVLPVHLFGQPADMAAITDICRRHKLLVVEDCAQSFGAAIDGRMTGTMGSFGCFSFFPSKNLGCYGDGGMVITDDAEYAERLRMLRNHGSKVRYHHHCLGVNSRLDELQAVILRTKLRHIDRYNQERRRVAHRYSQLLADTPLQTPYEDGIGRHVYHQYTLLGDRREEIMAALSAAEIASAVYYPIPLHRQEVYAAQSAGLSLPVTEELASRCFSLPIFPEMTDEQILSVVSTIRSALS